MTAERAPSPVAMCFARQPEHTHHLLCAGRHGVLSGYLIWRTLLRMLGISRRSGAEG